MAVEDRSNEVAPSDVVQTVREVWGVRALLVGAASLLQNVNAEARDDLDCAMSLIDDATSRLDGMSDGLERAAMKPELHRDEQAR